MKNGTEIQAGEKTDGAVSVSIDSKSISILTSRPYNLQKSQESAVLSLSGMRTWDLARIERLVSRPAPANPQRPETKTNTQSHFGGS